MYGYPLSISGSSTICDEETYTIENLSAGATVEWSIDNTNLALISNNSNKVKVSIKNQNIDVFGYATLSAKIRINGKQSEISKDITYGLPNISIDYRYNS